MMAHLGLGRASPPEFSHAQGAHVVGIGPLQQFRSATFTCARWRCGVHLPIENVAHGAHFSPCVEQPVLVENPPLQIVGHLFTLLFQPCRFAVHPHELLLKGMAFGLCCLFHPLQLRLHELALSGHFLPFLLTGRAFRAPFVALPFGLVHFPSPCFRALVPCFTALRQLLGEPCSFGRLAELADAAVECGDALFALLEVAVGLQQVVDGRHEVVEPAAAGKQAGVGSQETDGSVGALHHEHAEHLALLQFFRPLCLGGDVALQLPASLEGERMRLVAERISELVGKRQAGVERMKCSHACKVTLFLSIAKGFKVNNIWLLFNSLNQKI